MSIRFNRSIADTESATVAEANTSGSEDHPALYLWADDAGSQIRSWKNGDVPCLQAALNRPWRFTSLDSTTRAKPIMIFKPACAE